MTWLTRIVDRIVNMVWGCRHARTTWPFRWSDGVDRVCCLDCGRRIPYTREWVNR